MQHPLFPSWDICNREKQEIKTVSWCFNWLTFCKAWPESSLVVVEGLAVGCFAVVILLAYVRLLALAQSAQRRCHRTSTRNTAGTEKSADICQRRRKNKSGWGTENPDQKWKHIYGKKQLTVDYSPITLTKRMLLCPAQVVSGQQEAERETPSSCPSNSAVAAPVALQGSYVQAAVSHHSHRQSTASCR